MPLYDVGYRRWQGVEKGWLYRMLAITKSGARIVLKSLWVRISLVLGWMAAVGVGVSFFVFENVNEMRTASLKAEMKSDFDIEFENSKVDEFYKKLKSIPRELKNRKIQEFLARQEQMVFFFGKNGAEEIAEVMFFGSPREFRRVVWSRLLLMFFRMPQGLSLLIMIGWIAPPLISKDIRTKALLIYFSRPLSRLSYIGGKLLILVAVSASLATLPALLLYGFAVCLSPSVEVIADTWDLPGKIIFASMVHIVPCSLLALTLSSLTSESRYAMFAWFAIWGLGFISWTIVSLARFGDNNNFGDFYTAQANGDPFFILQFGSIYHVIADAQSAAMGLENGTVVAYMCMAYTFLMSLGCFALLWYRIGKVTNQ